MERADHSRQYMKPQKHTGTRYIIQHPNMSNQAHADGVGIRSQTSAGNHFAVINADMNLNE